MSDTDTTTEHKVLTNQMADPAKLIADAKPILITPSDRSSPLLSQPLVWSPVFDTKVSAINFAPPVKTMVPNFLSLDYDF